jgi:hypothetical protein
MGNLKPEYTRKGFFGKAYGRIIRYFRNRKRDAIRAEFQKRMKPTPCPDNPVAEFNYLLCARDFEMGVIAAFSLLHFSSRPLRLRFFEDGTLLPHHWDRLKAQFPGHLLFPRHEVDAKIEQDFGPNSNLVKIRRINPLFHKLIDIPYYSSDRRTTYSDPDILYLSDPVELVDAAAGQSATCIFNRDIENSYFYPYPEMCRSVNRDIPQRVNAGLYSIGAGAIDFALLDQWLGQKPFSEFWKSWRVEQTLFAFLPGESGFSVAHLSPPYDVDYYKKPEESPCKHYVGWIRHGFELEGLQYLMDSGKV